MPGESRARKGALPLPQWQIDWSEDQAGRARIAQAQRERWRVYRERVRSDGEAAA